MAKSEAPSRADAPAALEETIAQERRREAEPLPAPAAPARTAAAGRWGRQARCTDRVFKALPLIASRDAAVQWRVRNGSIVERSVDGGGTWTATEGNAGTGVWPARRQRLRSVGWSAAAGSFWLHAMPGPGSAPPRLSSRILLVSKRPTSAARSSEPQPGCLRNRRWRRDLAPRAVTGDSPLRNGGRGQAPDNSVRGLSPPSAGADSCRRRIGRRIPRSGRRG